MKAGHATLDPRELLTLGLATAVADDASAADGIVFDSRDAGPQRAFAALPGGQNHGREYIASALALGSPFVISDQPGARVVVCPDPTLALHRWATNRRRQTGARVVGITGSAGKTTAKTFVAAALRAGSPPGNLNTPHALACHILNTFTSGSREVLELGIDHVGEMQQLLALTEPDIGVITAVGQAHLDQLDSVEVVSREKGLILAGRPGFVHEDSAAFYPYLPGPSRVTYGFGPGAERRGFLVASSGAAVTFGYRGLRVELPTPSLAVASAAVLALALAEDAGLDLAEAAERITQAQVPGSRMRVQVGRFTLLDDAYNANPLSMKAALQSAGRFPRPRLAVLGDMKELGKEAEARHSELGLAAGGVFDHVIAVGEWADVTAESARQAGVTAEATTDAAEAIAAVLPLLSNGCAVLVKGSHSLGLEAVSEAVRHAL